MERIDMEMVVHDVELPALLDLTPICTKVASPSIAEELLRRTARSWRPEVLMGMPSGGKK